MGALVLLLIFESINSRIQRVKHIVIRCCSYLNLAEIISYIFYCEHIYFNILYLNTRNYILKLAV